MYCNVVLYMYIYSQYLKQWCEEGILSSAHNTHEETKTLENEMTCCV